MFDSRIVSGISIFVSVAQTRNYLLSSKLVGMSRSGISRSISRLETRLGFRLFERSARGVKLTDEGRIFYEKVAPLLNQLGEFAARSPSQAPRVRGRVRVCCESAFATLLLIPHLPELKRRHPGLQIDLVLTSSVNNLITDGYDVAIRFGEPSLPGIEKRILFHTRVLTCASRGYVEQYGIPKSLEDFDGRFPCVRHIDDTTGRPYDWVCVNRRAEVRIHKPECTITVSDSPGIIAALLNGVGIVRTLDFMTENLIASGEVVEILPEWNHRPWPAYLYWRSHAPQSPGLDAFIRFVQEATQHRKHLFPAVPADG